MTLAELGVSLAAALAAWALGPWSGAPEVPAPRQRLVVAAMAAAMGGWLIRQPTGLPWVSLVGLSAAWAWVTLVDGQFRIIPNRWVVATALLGFFGRLFVHAGIDWSGVALAAGLFLFLGGFHLISRGGLGMGDVKFGAALGLALGWPAGMWATVLGLWAAAAWAGWLAWRGRRPREGAVALGPFLVLGALLGVLGPVSWR